MKNIRRLATCLALWVGLIFAASAGKSETISPNPVMPAHTRTLYLIRHGAYDMNEHGDDHLVNGLVPLGVAQARLTGARLGGLPERFDALISSTMTRARETARVVGQSLPGLTLVQDPLLCECLPPSRSNKVNKSVDARELAAAQQQLEAAFAKYFVPAGDHNEHEILVCHGNVIRWFVCRALDVDTKAWLGFSVAHCSLTIVEVLPDGRCKVLGVGETGHIPANLTSGITGGTPILTIPEIPTGK